MERDSVILSHEAETDISLLFRHIRSTYKQPLTAIRYVLGVNKAIQKLSVHAEAIAVNQNKFIQSLYGPGVRRVNYKKTAILFVVRNNRACVKRVIAASLIR